MPKDTITFVLEGSAARNGNIPADVFVAKLKQFVSTMYSFDRAYAGRAKRGVDLEIFDLRRVNPALVLFSPRSLVRGYDADASVAWTINQFQNIANRNVTDSRVSQDALDNVIDLATIRKAKAPALASLRIEYDHSEVRLDKVVIGNALALRHTRRLEPKEVWKPGISKGSIFGELKGVTDMRGEKSFFVVAPNGRDTQCIFPEHMRHAVQENLWNLVRVTGFMRYNAEQPKPYLIEAEKIEPVLSAEGQPHMLDMKGAFQGYDDVDHDELV